MADEFSAMWSELLGRHVLYPVGHLGLKLRREDEARDRIVRSWEWMRLHEGRGGCHVLCSSTVLSKDALPFGACRFRKESSKTWQFSAKILQIILTLGSFSRPLSPVSVISTASWDDFVSFR